jgi:DNA invertase Pin-like site-specific DNA recombinase
VIENKRAGSRKKPAMKIGYARVSTDEQNLDLQLHALQDRLSGALSARPGLRAALERPEVTKRFSDTHKRTKVERRSDRRRATRVFSSHCRLGALGEMTANT